MDPLLSHGSDRFALHAPLRDGTGFTQSPDAKSLELFPLNYRVEPDSKSNHEDILRACQWLGIAPGDDPLAKLGLLIGAPHGSRLSVSTYEDQELNRQDVDLSCSWGKEMGRMVFVEGYGGPIFQLMHYANITKNLSNPRDFEMHFDRIEMRGIDTQGIGSRIVAMMVQNACSLGLTRIKATGIKKETSRNHRSDQIGYYFLPRLGFDNPLKAALRRFSTQGNYVDLDTRDFIRKAWPGTQRISDLMDTPEKRAWWKANGEVVQLAFDLRPRSPSIEVHQAYLREKQICLPHLQCLQLGTRDDDF